MVHIILELFLIGHTFNLLSTLYLSPIFFSFFHHHHPPIRYLTTIISSQIRRHHHRLVIITTQLSDFVFSNLRKKHEAVTSGSAFTKSKSIDSGYQVMQMWCGDGRGS
ncbi:hypothetical protein YC2023_119101 [Brassica napus]